MRKPLLLTLLSLAVAISSFADERHQSYVSYDDGGTIVRSGEDGREIEVRRNLPIYPGDEVVTARRGRAEVRLSDGNIVGIDRTTAVLFRSILDSYEGDANETVAELRNGKVAVHRTDLGRDHVRLDTDSASYVAEDEAIYSVETANDGADRVTVFEGSLEVRTPTRATRLRAGESASVDDGGVYDLIGDRREAADDFERWFLKRAERFDGYSSKYVDRRLGYWTDDLDDYGRWVFVTGIGWSWRPFVAAGWRPYYHGYWYHSRNGCLTWVSYDPWGWGPYHYGRWSFDPGFGWVWVPGTGYAPAWVYWMYGPSYIGWAPAGWWDCYRPYYGWAYSPYRGYGNDYRNFGFYGRVRVNELDLRPWTFVDSNTIISNRVDRAALTIDAVKQRLGRSPDGFATLSGGAARFTREEFRDPAEAIRRRGLDGRMTGRETGAPMTDVTPFVRRDPEVGGAIRDRVARSRGGSGATPVAGGVTGTTPSRGVAPIPSGSLAPIGRGSVAPIGGGSQTPAATTPSRRGGGSDGRIGRGSNPADEPSRNVGGDRPAVPRDTDRSGTWRSRIGERDREGTREVTPPPSSSSGETPRAPRDSWRSRVRTDEPARGDSGSSRDRSATSGSSDVPRRIIDRIGGARVVPRDGGSTRSTGGDRDRSSGRGSSTRESGGSRNSGGSRESARPSPPPPPPSSSNSGSSSSGRSSGGSSRGSGGHIQRDH